MKNALLCAGKKWTLIVVGKKEYQYLKKASLPFGCWLVIPYHSSQPRLPVAMLCDKKRFSFPAKKSYQQNGDIRMSKGEKEREEEAF